MNKELKTIYDALDEKKGIDIKIIDISKISIMSDYFIIASASSDTQLDTLVNNVEDKLKENYDILPRIEGNKKAGWVLLDYKDFIIHVFDIKNREFYNLERIWSDGEEVGIETL